MRSVALRSVALRSIAWSIGILSSLVSNGLLLGKELHDEHCQVLRLRANLTNSILWGNWSWLDRNIGWRCNDGLDRNIGWCCNDGLDRSIGWNHNRLNHLHVLIWVHRNLNNLTRSIWNYNHRRIDWWSNRSVLHRNNLRSWSRDDHWYSHEVLLRLDGSLRPGVGWLIGVERKVRFGFELFLVLNLLPCNMILNHKVEVLRNFIAMCCTTMNDAESDVLAAAWDWHI